MNPLTLVKRIQNINSKEAALGISDDASWHAKYKDSAYVFVGGIPFDLTEGDLLAVFAQYGEIVDVNLVRDKGTGKSKGFAFVAYEDQRSTILAVDNLNGAQILGRIVRVDHVTNYKKKEEEDEETRQQKREERGVCRAFQKGECTRGDGCKFSHDEQRAANTGGGPQDKSSRWRHEKFEGNKDSSSRARGSERDFEGHHKKSDIREEKKPRRCADEFEPNSREDHYSREGRRSRRHANDESELRPGDQYKTEEKRLRRLVCDDEFEPRSREEHYRREERRSAKHKSESYLREDRDRRVTDKLSTWHGDSSSHRYRERDDHQHKSDR